LRKKKKRNQRGIEPVKKKKIEHRFIFGSTLTRGSRRIRKVFLHRLTQISA
jgi:hypothetical protein